MPPADLLAPPAHPAPQPASAASPDPAARTPRAPRSGWQDPALLAIPAAALLLALWDTTPLDLLLAQRFSTGGGFPLRESWWLSKLLHDDVRRLAWAAATALVVGVWLPWGPLRHIDLPRRAALAVGLLLSLALVSAGKALSHTSCPWDLAQFGGAARYVSHWHWGLRDGGSGHCFPGGHASAGFAFLSLYFAWRDDAPRLARISLVAALLGGLALGAVQQLRGAHFLSHNLWTAWLCWTTCWAVDAVRRRWFGPARPPADANANANADTGAPGVFTAAVSSPGRS